MVLHMDLDDVTVYSCSLHRCQVFMGNLDQVSPKIVKKKIEILNYNKCQKSTRLKMLPVKLRRQQTRGGVRIFAHITDKWLLHLDDMKNYKSISKRQPKQ